MKKCNLCGQEIQGWGNNPWPLCDIDDYNSVCCDGCNSTKVIAARLLQTKSKEGTPKVGDEIAIFWLYDEPRAHEYVLRKGKIESIDDIGQLHGTWGGLAINPEVDSFCIL